MTRSARTALLDEADRYCKSADKYSDPIPTSWTAQLVEARLVEAFETLPAASGRIGPKSYGSNWPTILGEFAKLVGEWWLVESREASGKERPRPTLSQISRMEEALQWPARYLADDPKMADALNLWASAKAAGRDIKALLQHRAGRAAELAVKHQVKVDAEREAALDALGEEVNDWAEAQYARGDMTEDRAEVIKANARIRYEREVVKRKLQSRMVEPADMMPDRVINQNGLDRNRRMAASLLAIWLERAKVRVRVPDKERRFLRPG